MNINKVIEKIETRKRITENYKKEIQKIFDFITSLKIDFDCASEKNIYCRYNFFDGNNWKYIDSKEQNLCWNTEIVIGISNGDCAIYEKSFQDHGVILENPISLSDIGYFNIQQMNDAIFSILTQIENCSDRSAKLNQILEITKKL